MMASIKANKARGAATQAAVAGYLTVNGWPYATDAGAGRSGSDILGTPGLCIEVKARKDFSPLAWLRQAATGGAGIPMCIHRPDGMGVTSVAAWPVTLRLADLVALLRDAGYGDPDPEKIEQRISRTGIRHGR
jgi:hypothetical protein